MYYGYNRVSTKEQSLDRGRNSIIEYCNKNNIKLEKIYEDKSTGKNFNRERYIVLKEDVVRPGDVIIVPEFDRLGRAEETKNELEYFKDKNVRIIFLDIPTTQIDLSTMSDEMSKLILNCVNDTLISFYNLMSITETKRRKKRQEEGIIAKKNRGDWDDYGRPRVMPIEDFEVEYRKVEDKEIGSLELMKKLNLKQSTYYRYIKELKSPHGEDLINNKK